MNDHEALFGEFGPVSTQEWEEKILKDLKDCTMERLTWKSPEGIEVKPFYRKEDLEGLEYLKAEPGEYPYHNTRRLDKNNWEIRQDIYVNDWQEANTKALDVLKKGATSLGFVIPDSLRTDIKGLRILLNDIYFNCINLNFITTVQAAAVFRSLRTLAEEKGIDPAAIYGSIDADPLGYLTMHGNYPGGTEKAFEDMSSLIREADATMPGLRIIGINGRHFANAGSTLVEELGFSLALLSEYLDKLNGRGLSMDQIARSFQLNFTAGPAYFMEIAKVRAARLLYTHLLEAWDPEGTTARKCFIHMTTAEWNQTVYDHFVNVLRATTESMSAIIGGTDSLSVMPFDHPFRDPEPFAGRIARNIQIILREESFLDKVTDPSSGAWYIENLTDSLADNAWKLFLETEERGGYLQALEEGFIQRRVRESAGRKDQELASRKSILTGTNQYPDSSESFPVTADLSRSFPEKDKNSGNIIEPLTVYRGARPYEKLRLHTEQLEKKPAVFLLTTGNRSWRKARATFAWNFFACGGFEVTDNPGFSAIDDGLDAAFRKNADIIVLCSSDEEYRELAPEAFQKIRGKAIFVVAGYPEDSLEELKSRGIVNFIHRESNLLEELRKYHKLLGLA